MMAPEQQWPFPRNTTTHPNAVKDLIARSRQDMWDYLVLHAGVPEARRQMQAMGLLPKP